MQSIEETKIEKDAASNPQSIGVQISALTKPQLCEAPVSCSVTPCSQAIPMKRWNAFLKSLALDQKVDFEEGDIGLAGGAAACFGIKTN